MYQIEVEPIHADDEYVARFAVKLNGKQVRVARDQAEADRLAYQIEKQVLGER